MNTPTPRPTRSSVFDVRSVIGAIFVVYGLILVVVGLTAGPESLAKSQQININLWTGLGCLVLGLVFAAWVLARPVVPAGQEPATVAEESP